MITPKQACFYICNFNENIRSEVEGNLVPKYGLFMGRCTEGHSGKNSK